MPWAVIVFGWPAVIASILITLTALVVRSSRLALTGAVVALPFMVYIFGGPRFRLIAPLIVGSHVAVAFALRRGRPGLALALALPFIALAAFVASLVVNQ